jgi:hypothetical protein
MRRLSLVALFGAAVLCIIPGVAAAGALIFDDTVSTCTALNCSSLRIPGTVTSFGGSAGYFEIGLFATPGTCLRAEVITQGADLEMVVRAPNGQIFRNDDKGGASCPLCPRVVVRGAPSNGWYSTTLYQFAGAGVDTNFTLLYGRYSPLTNPNCNPATVPAAAPAESQADKASEGSSPSRPGDPGH